MPQTPPIVVKLTPELEAELRTIRDELVPALQAAGDLANAAGELLEFIPADVSPVVIVRDRVAPLQAALDAFMDHASVILEAAPPATEDEPPARDVDTDPPARELEPEPPAREVALPDELRDSDTLPASERLERGNARNMLDAAHRAGSCTVVLGAERRAAERLELLGLVTYNRADRRVELPA